MGKYEQSGLFDQQRCCIFDAVKALWTVEHKTFIDVVLKVTRDAVIKRREDWIHFDIHQHKTIIENAVEDPDTAAMRERLKKDLANLEDCLQELQKIKTCKTFHLHGAECVSKWASEFVAASAGAVNDHRKT